MPCVMLKIIMLHFMLVVYLFAVLSGIAVTTWLRVVKEYQQDPVISAFTLYHASVFALVLGYILALYKHMNISPIEDNFEFMIQIYLKSFISLIIYSLPAFTLKLFSPSRRAVFTYIKAVAVGLWLFNLSPYLFNGNTHVFLINCTHLVQSILLVSTLLWCFVFSMVRINAQPITGILTIVKAQLTLLLVFFPFFLLDMFHTEVHKLVPIISTQVWYTPFFFIFLNGIILHVLKHQRLLPPKPVTTNDMNYRHHFQRYHVSKREAEVIQLLLDGLTASEIAKQLYISESTVKKHLQSIYEKTDVRNRVELIKKLSQPPVPN